MIYSIVHGKYIHVQKPDFYTRRRCSCPPGDRRSSRGGALRDAEKTGFPSRSFDIITEYGALHHLDLETAYGEMARILKPNGKAICVEALGHNPFIHLYRRLTPSLRTEWEVNHILRKRDVALASKYFHKVDMEFFHLATLVAVPFRNSASFDRLLSALEQIDEAILRFPVLKWQAWQIVFTLSQPINA